MSAELFVAIKQGDLSTVRRLVEADPALGAAREEGGVSAVLTAVYHRQPEVAAYLVSKGPPLDIFEAAAVGDADRVARLLDEDPSRLDDFASDGFHPLGLAAFFKRPEVVRLLLERGADTSLASRNPLRVTPLHSAVADDADRVDISIVRALLDAGAPLDPPHLGGGAPLHSVAFTGNVEVARLLLERGADPSRTTDAGKTPADIARQRGHTELAALLDSRG